MSATERSELLSNLYELRANCGVQFNTANRERLLHVAAMVAMAREALSDAIEKLQQESTEIRAADAAQNQMFP